MQFNATSESLAQRGMELLVQAPFWAALFIRVNRRVEEHRAAALQLVLVDGAPAIEVAPRHWAALKESEQLLAIQHELTHLLLGHPAQRTLYGAPFLYDVAADLVVAQFLPEGVKFELDLDAAATDLDGLYQALIIAWEQESQDLLAL
ncbi:MAG: hypothetical protein KDC44_19355, partial [Phaeodactylibacter sp.]|nr:hypothetical protein [Phaeodactylibacter sp.]